MSYTLFKHNSICLDVMAPEEYWAKIVSILRSCECAYSEEDHTEVKDLKYVVIKDIQCPYGYRLGEAIGKIYSLDPNHQALQRKFYILIKPKRRVKKDVEEVRQEVNGGSDSGDSGESSGDIGEVQSGQDLGPGGSGTGPARVNADDLRGIEVGEDAAATDDYCD